MYGRISSFLVAKAKAHQKANHGNLGLRKGLWQGNKVRNYFSILPMSAESRFTNFTVKDGTYVISGKLQ